MEVIKDFFSELRERASNPLLSSFVIAWLLVNWPITIGLLFYTQKDLQLDNIKSYAELINKYSSFWYNAILPLLIALIYAFLFPYLKAAIKLVHAKISAKNESDILKATQQGMIPVKKYVELRDAQQSMTSELRELIDGQGAIHNANAELITKLAEEANKYNLLSAEKTKLEEQVASFHKFTDARLLNGKWKYTVKDLMGKDYAENWEISDGILDINGNKMRISDMVANSLTLKIAFRVTREFSSNRRQDSTSYIFTYNPEFTQLHDRADPELILTKEPSNI